MPRKNAGARDARHRHANPELAKAMRDLRSSNAAQPHVETPRKGTRAARERDAIHDQARHESEGA